MGLMGWCVWLTNDDLGGDPGVLRWAGMDCRLAALFATGEREPGEGKVTWDMDWGREKGAELMGVEELAPR